MTTNKCLEIIDREGLLPFFAEHQGMEPGTASEADVRDYLAEYAHEEGIAQRLVDDLRELKP